MNVLVINAGSSSLKYALVTSDDDGGQGVRAEGLVERIGLEGTRLVAHRKGADAAEERRGLDGVTGPEDALAVATGALTSGPTAVLASLDAVDAVGHRVVHGGDVYSDPVVIDDGVKATIEDLASLAPLHNPANLAGIRAAERLLPGRPHVAVFDTAFHATIPGEAHLYGLPLDFARDRRLRRYGFHGTSHKYVSGRARELLGVDRSRRLVTAHIGNGVSLTAVRDGRSIDTTMGFTPLEGVVMGTRSGTLDPAIVIHLIRHAGMDADAVDRLLNRQSGLYGMAAVGSGDLRDVLEAREAGLETAAMAYDVYVYRLVTAIGALAAALDGLDALVFTAGAGEHSSELRQDVCARLGYLGVRLDPEANRGARPDCDVTAEGVSPRVLVVATQEDVLIARETLAVLGQEAS